MPTQHLKQALEALSKGDRVKALNALLEAWRACRAPAIEEVIDVVSRDVARALPPLEAADATTYDVAWADLEERGRAIDVHHLLSGLWSPPKGSIGLRREALKDRGPDPRVGAGFVRMIQQPPMTARTSWSTWSALFGDLPDFVDSRVRATLEERAASHDGDSNFWPKLSRWIEVVLPKLPEPASLEPADAEQVVSLLARANELAEGPPPTAVDPDNEKVAIALEDVLHVALERVQSDELEVALEALCVFWAARRSPTVASLIEAIDELIDSSPLAAGTLDALHARWMQVAEDPSAVKVRSLLWSLRRGRKKHIPERLAIMTTWRPDPRVKRFVERFGVRASKVLEHHAHGEGDHLSPTELKQLERIARVVHGIIDRHSPQLSIGSRETTAFIEAIIADADNPQPYLVFSDWLIERADPMGEHIALSVALEQGKQVKGKLAKYRRQYSSELLGELGSVLWIDSYKLGVPNAVQLHAHFASNLDEDVWDDWRWSTIEVLKSGHEEGIDAVLQRAPLLSLRRLSYVRPADLAAIETPMPLEWVELAVDPDEDVDWGTLDTRAEKFFPHLREIRLSCYDDEDNLVAPPVAMLASQIAQRLDRLVVGDSSSGMVPFLDAWVERLDASALTTPHVELITPDIEAVLTRQGKRRQLAVKFNEWLRLHDDEWEILLEVLPRIPPALISKTTVAFSFEDDDGRSAPLLAAMQHLNPTVV